LRAGRSPSRDLAKDIFAFLRQRLAPYKRIRRLELPDLPKTISGKTRKVELRVKEARIRAGSQRGKLEFFEEDFRELKG
jgi:acetyl-CoA synthetase